jgi:hypothetical protein
MTDEPQSQPNPFDDPDIQAIIAEIPKDELAMLESSDAVRAFLAQPEVQDSGIYKFGALELRHRRFMTHKLRQIIAKGSTRAKASDDPMKSTEDTIYRALSEICMDSPYNTPTFWMLVDTKSTDGRVHKIFADLIEKLGGGEKDIKSFR